MNWGTKAAIGMATFMTFIMVLGVLMFNSNTDALVENDYYEKGIDYNKDYKRKEQVKTDQAKPKIESSQQRIILTFKENATGTLKLLRSSDKALDRTVSFKTDPTNRVIIPTESLKKGSWRIIAEWVSHEKAYLDEQEIIIK